MKNPKIIVISGAESTGKSTLTKALADCFQVPFIPEIARDFVEQLERPYNYNDIETIAKSQVDQLQSFRSSNHPYIFVDTWLINTKVWFEAVYKKVPSWIEDVIKNTKIDLFLVCKNDLPWIADPVRENGGEAREFLQKEYVKNINKYHFQYKIISGKNDERLKNALEHPIFIKQR